MARRFLLYPQPHEMERYLLMADVETERDEGGKVTLRHYIPSLAGWVLPGAGHFILGHRIRGLVFFLLVVFSLSFGLGLKGKVYVIERDKPMTYAGVFANLGLGPSYFLLKASEIGKGEPSAPSFAYGKTFVTTAGLMNILLLLDAFDIATGRKAYRKSRKTEEEGN